MQPEHDARRAPATYDRILKHIDGHQITVHCTVTRQQTARDGYIEEFVRTWSGNRNVRSIWLSLYTPQVGEDSPERLTAADRRAVVNTLREPSRTVSRNCRCRGSCSTPTSNRRPHHPTASLRRTTECVSADLRTQITPCQFGGTPDCSSCGCMASAGLAAVGRHRLGGVIPIDALFDGSIRIGQVVNGLRRDGRPAAVDYAAPPTISAARSSASCTVLQMFSSPSRS